MLIDEAEDGAWNMALDEAILDAVAANASPPTLRLYQWKRPTVSVGRFQNIARTIHPDVCARHDIPLVRRITGGRGILHGADLTVSLTAPIEALGFDAGASVSALALYQKTAEGFLRAFARVGIAAAMGVCAREKATVVNGNCFATISRADIVEAGSGRKLLGAALHRRERFVLEQVSIPLRRELSPFPYEGEGRGGVFAGEQPQPDSESGLAASFLPEWREMLISELMKTLGASFVRGRTSADECARAGALVAAKYADAAWTETGSRNPAVR